MTTRTVDPRIFDEAVPISERLKLAAREWELRAQGGSDFARGKREVCLDLARVHLSGGRFVSAAQGAYANKLIAWLRPRPAAVVASVAALTSPAPVNVSRIQSLFAAAFSHGLRRPKIAFRHNGVWVTMKRDGRGEVWVRNQNDRLLARISSDGVLHRLSSCSDAEVAAIVSFATDPLGVARAHGHATGNCCFCRRALTDSRSVAMGYGPVCATHFGLDWGNRRAAEVVVDVVGTADVPPAVRETMRQIDAAEAQRAAGLAARVSRVIERNGIALPSHRTVESVQLTRRTLHDIEEAEQRALEQRNAATDSMPVPTPLMPNRAATHRRAMQQQLQYEDEDQQFN